MSYHFDIVCISCTIFSVFFSLTDNLFKLVMKCIHISAVFSLLEIARLLTGTLANSEDPDEMPHNAAFHQSLHCLL